ncbi:uncharacterized protein LOC125498643 [Beta vulgaris subsp. vulgaris]|uniref:uncharacterized protein LOC125498643 n=1 Tax=Beta vulgaris subsp. vulgaris TaxID=3555 RepID=UPI0020367B41|nr:uncharacterized protein LOC125498643 [Beta vulgaris subsp. vulgaris]
MENDNEHEDDEDHVDEMMAGVEDELGKHSRVFESLTKAAQKPLYPGCKKFTKLSAVLTLFNIKSKGNWTDISFNSLLEVLSEMFPDGNELPKSTYYARKLMCPFGLEYKKINACQNDCVLYRNEYDNLDKCPQFKRLFSKKKDAKNLRWHADRRKKDGLLKHQADSPEWNSINRLHKPFGDEDRNLRLRLCTDGMNPSDCMKCKYMMLSLLISGPKQPGNNIDVYLTPLVDDLRKLWDEGVSVLDAHTNEMFTLRAMLFCTINDFLAYGNLSGYKNKGKKACPICIDDMESTWISKCKHVYMPHGKFLRLHHPIRKKKNAFDGKVEERVARRVLTGEEVYEQDKGVETIFGKTMQKDTGLWKKESVLWTLPY